MKSRLYVYIEHDVFVLIPHHVIQPLPLRASSRSLSRHLHHHHSTSAVPPSGMQPYCSSLTLLSLIISQICKVHTLNWSSNTFSLNFILRFSSFNLHHFIYGLPVLVFNLFSPHYSSLGIGRQSRFHHQLSLSTLDPSVPKNVSFSFSIQPTRGS